MTGEKMIKNKFCRDGGRALRIAIGITMSIVLLAISASALSNSGGGSWQYSKNIIISNSGGILTDYQVLISLDSSNFPSNAQNSGADIRFTDSRGNELDYWIESWDSVTKNAKIWIKMPSIPSGATMTYMYYGNPSATSSSNGSAVFDFFDDFHSISETWTCAVASNQFGYGSCSASNSVATVTGGTNDWWSLFASGAASLSPPLSVEFFSKDTVVYPGGFIIGMASSQSLVSPTYAVFFMGGTAVWNNGFESFNNGVSSSEGSSNDLPNFSVVRIDVYGTKIDYYVNGSLVHTKTTNVPTGGMKVILSAAQPSSSISTDWVRVRKYASIEPLVTMGPETAIQMPKNITVSPSNASIVVGNSQTFTAITKDQLGNPINAIVTWSSSNTSVGTFDPSTGVFTAKATGTTTVTAINGSISGSASVTVTHKFRFVQLTDVHIGPDVTSCLEGVKKSLVNGTVACVESYAESIDRFKNVQNHILNLNSAIS